MLSVDEARDTRPGHRSWPTPVTEPVTNPAGFAVLITAPRATLLVIEEDLRWLKARNIDGLSQHQQLQLDSAHLPLRDPLAKALREARISQEPAPYIGFNADVASDLFEVLDLLFPTPLRGGLLGLAALNDLLGDAYCAFEGCGSQNRVVQLDVDGIRHLPTIDAPGELPVMNHTWVEVRQRDIVDGWQS